MGAPLSQQLLNLSIELMRLELDLKARDRRVAELERQLADARVIAGKIEAEIRRAGQ